MPLIKKYKPSGALGILEGTAKEELERLPFGGLEALVQKKIRGLCEDEGGLLSAEETMVAIGGLTMTISQFRYAMRSLDYVLVDKERFFTKLSVNRLISKRLGKMEKRNKNENT